MAESTGGDAAVFAAGSISLRLYPHELRADALVSELLAQARLAEAVGFDGLMTSEHHGGFPGYLPNPLQLTGFLLGETSGVWAAPCPLLLPLRHWSHVAEELAWLAARFPGRVGAGVAVGALARDFELADSSYAERFARFREQLPQLARALRGEAAPELAGDAALAACAQHPVPLVVAGQTAPALRRAARLSLGLLFDSLQTAENLRELSEEYRKAGGGGPRILIRRVWLGAAPALEAERQQAFYRSYADPAAQARWGRDELVQAESGEELAEALDSLLQRSGCDSLDLRIHLRGIAPDAIRAQIERLGRDLLPALRARLADAR
jgi:alkanesulfonate monooxygenase SsuD/methylene tetrahydromethanopterin reductase-like flavin-dependent oxidoreductase (luciferase family)